MSVRSNHPTPEQAFSGVDEAASPSLISMVEETRTGLQDIEGQIEGLQTIMHQMGLYVGEEVDVNIDAKIQTEEPTPQEMKWKVQECVHTKNRIQGQINELLRVLQSEMVA